MKIDHVALYVENLESMRAFYEEYFSARANEKYHNPRTGLHTYFLSFSDGCRLEIMTRPDLQVHEKEMTGTGYIHLAISVGGKKLVDELVARLKTDGFTVVSGPRTTGDGYYEACVLDPEGNQIEIVA